MAFDFGSFSAILLDLDGTLYKEEHALPGAADLVASLRREGRRFACLSNGTSSPDRIAQRLARMGISIPPSRIYSAAAASADYVLERFAPRPRVFNLCTEGVHDLLDGRVDWVSRVDEECDAIIIGVPLNVYATEDRQRTAMLLARQGALLVGTCADRVYPSPRGLEIGAGSLTAMLAYAADARPVYCGKPERIFFERLCDLLGADPHQCLLIGDNLESDIAGARAMGMKTILTLTGVAGREELAELAPEKRPEWVVEDLCELL